MDIVINFKRYLFTQKNPPSKITIKNYIADVKKFINWYEKDYGLPFTTSTLTGRVVTTYDAYLKAGKHTSLPAARSTKRYFSSLRRFSAFLKESGAIAEDPFEAKKEVIVITDPYYLKEFNNYLFTEHASSLTMKNYTADIKQFLDWLSKVTERTDQMDSSTLITTIDNSALEQYKMRLLEQAKLSPISINRKLSSLRRYIRWLAEKGILSNTVAESSFYKAETPPVQQNQSTPIKESLTPIEKEFPLTALQGLTKEQDENRRKEYARFGPIRLAQKLSRIINLGADLLIFNPIAKSAENLHYLLWKKGQKEIFTPVNTILESNAYSPQGVSVKTIIPKNTNMIRPRSTLLDRLTKFKEKANSETVHNFSKTLYAPLMISTKHMHVRQKLWHYLRYNRPNWYRKYHAFAFVNYLHFGIMLIAAVIAGTALYQAWNEEPIKESQAVLSAQAISPPRTLTFQGRLLDKTNTPIAAETPLRFALYNEPTATGAALLWQEKQYITPDQNGNFTATLGTKNRIDQSFFTDNASLYIGIAVGDNHELLPRQQIPTTNYAANSQSVEGLKPITDSPDLAKNVLLSLDSSGDLTIGGESSHTFRATGGQFTLSGQALEITTNPSSNGNIQIIPDGSGIIDMQKPIQNTSNYTGPSGITGSVEVDDILSVLATTSSQSALVVNQNGTGDIISARGGGIDKFRLDRGGNAFLSGNLILKGDTINTTSTSFDIGGSTVNNLSIGTNASVISLGGSSGITSIRNSLSVRGTTTLNGPVNTSGLITANAGLTIPAGQNVILQQFDSGAIPYVNDNSQLVQDASFSWDDAEKRLNINGSICLYSTVACDTTNATPGTISFNNGSAFSADLAENYISSQQLEPGDVVVLEGKQNNQAIIKSTSPYQKELLGIVSTQPGFTLNSGATTDATHPHVYPLALQGRVPVNVTTINGPIQPGDDLTSSAIPGVAMKATNSGQIIGKALEGYTNQNTAAVGKIMAFVNLTYRASPTVLTDTGNLPIATDSAGWQSDQNGSISINSSIVNPVNDITHSIKISGQSLSDYLTNLTEKLITKELDKRLAQKTQNSPSTTDQNVSSNSAQVETTQDKSTSSSAELTAKNSLIYNSIASQSGTASSAADKNFSASESAETTTTPLPTDVLNQNGNNTSLTPAASLSGQLTYIPNFKSDFATFTQGLIALGPTSLTDVSVNDTIVVNNNLRIAQNAIDTIGSDLNIEPLRQGNVLFMGGLIAIDTDGNLAVNGSANFAHDVRVNGQLAAGIIAPVPNQDLVISLNDKKNKSGSSLIVTDATGSGVLKINQSGDITSSGGAKFTSVSTNGFSIIRGAEADTSTTETMANSSAGKGVITAYQTERTIVTPYVTDHSLIYITATSNTSGIIPYLARQTAENPKRGSKGSFTVAIPSSAPKNVSFNWWIVN